MLLQRLKNEQETSRKENPETELIDPTILEFEKQFALRRGGLQSVLIKADDEGDNEGDEDSDIASLLRSVLSIDSIAQNADFVGFGF